MQIIKDKPMLLTALVSLLLLILANTSLAPLTAEWFNQDKIVHIVDEYLDQSEQVAGDTLTKLTGLAALTAVFQSSEVGISFFVDVRVGVGQLLATFNNVLERSIEVTLLSAAVVKIIKFIIDFSESLTPWLFNIMLLGGLIYGLGHTFTSPRSTVSIVSGRIGRLALSLFVVFHLLLPYSLYGAALVSQHLTADSKQAHHAMLANLHRDMGAANQKASLKNKAEDAIHTFEKVVVDLPHKVEHMVEYHSRHMALNLFEFILLPIALFALSLTALWSVLRSFSPKMRLTLDRAEP